MNKDEVKVVRLTDEKMKEKAHAYAQHAWETQDMASAWVAAQLMEAYYQGMREYAMLLDD